MQRTTIALPNDVRDRLKTFGRQGMSYAEIVSRLMDAVDRNRFLADIDDGVPAAPSQGGPAAPAVGPEPWRRMTPRQRLALGEEMRQQATLVNPIGTRRLLESRRRPK